MALAIEIVDECSLVIECVRKCLPKKKCDAVLAIDSIEARGVSKGECIRKCTYSEGFRRLCSSFK